MLIKFIRIDAHLSERQVTDKLVQHSSNHILCLRCSDPAHRQFIRSALFTLDYATLVQFGNTLIATRKTKTKNLFVYAHIPKCGGQSFEHYFFTLFNNQVIIDSNPPNKNGDFGHFQQLLLANPDAMFLSSQRMRLCFPQKVFSRRLLYMTFIRKPEAQVISFLKYIRTKYDTFPPSFKCELPILSPDMTLSEVFLLLIKEEKEQLIFNILPTYFFAGRDNALTAYDKLKQFDYIGVLERYDESIERLHGFLSEYGYQIEIEENHHVNASRAGSTELAELRENSIYQSFLDAHIAESAKLYDLVLQDLFDDNCSKKSAE